MKIITLDFETFFSDEFSLSRMSQEAYCRDQRFIPHGAAIKWTPETPAKWYTHRELVEGFPRVDWADTAVVGHHLQFDAAILNWTYGVKPKFLFDTLSMARQVLGNHLSVSLDAVRKHYGIPAKITPYSQFKGKLWHEMTLEVQRAVAAGAEDEVESIWRLFQIMGKEFPQSEYEVVDITIRAFTEPHLKADTALLASVWEKEAERKRAILETLQLDASELQSAEKFAALLRAEGVEPEQKEGKNGPIYAFAKTDDFMRELVEHENARVRTLAEARLGQKSTLMQTRAETLGWMASRGSMPVYLRYCGAHTTRWSGGDGANWQNFKRGSDIRRAIMAPDGYLLGAIDLSQIELRVLSFLAGQWDVLEDLRNGADPYTKLASTVYGREITKADAAERGTGKQLRLSCGYQAGAQTILNTAKLGIYGPPIYIDLEEATRWRDIYRRESPHVVNYWAEAGRMIARIAGGPPLDWGPMHIRDGRVYGPNGGYLHYETLEHYRDEEHDDAYWRIKTRRGWSRLYSGRLVENVTQFLARIVMSEAMVRIARAGYRILNCTHDELLILIPRDGREEGHLEYCKQEMKKTPAWLPDVPLDAEAHMGERYAK